jgi:hypothetical protein
MITEIDHMSYRRFIMLLSGLSVNSTYINVVQNEKEEPQELSNGQSTNLIKNFFG